jgi:hypothetical protein
MKVLAIICRVLLGLIFVIFGANGLHQFIPGPMPGPGTPVGDFFTVMHNSGWMSAVAAFQVIGGLLVLVPGTVPLGLVVLAPIIVNIFLFHILLAGGHGLGPGLAVLVLELLLIYLYRSAFTGILTTKAHPVE